MNYLVDGEVVDTYGGDYTYRDVWYDVDDGKIYIYEKYYGAKRSNTEHIKEYNSEYTKFLNQAVNDIANDTVNDTI